MLGDECFFNTKDFLAPGPRRFGGYEVEGPARTPRRSGSPPALWPGGLDPGQATHEQPSPPQDLTRPRLCRPQKASDGRRVGLC